MSFKEIKVQWTMPFKEINIQCSIPYFFLLSNPSILVATLGCGCLNNCNIIYANCHVYHNFNFNKQTITAKTNHQLCNSFSFGDSQRIVDCATTLLIISLLLMIICLCWQRCKLIQCILSMDPFAVFTFPTRFPFRCMPVLHMLYV